VDFCYLEISVQKYEKRSVLSKLAIIALVLQWLVISSCTWSSRAEFTSPDGVTHVKFSEKEFFSDSRIKIELISKSGTQLIYSDDADWHLGITEVFWSSDSQVVSVIACNAVGGTVALRHDIRSKSSRSDAQVRSDIGNLILRRYHPENSELKRNQGDPIRWVCAHEAADDSLHTIKQTLIR
jgi:hypothetical protein